MRDIIVEFPDIVYVFKKKLSRIYHNCSDLITYGKGCTGQLCCIYACLYNIQLVVTNIYQSRIKFILSYDYLHYLPDSYNRKKLTFSLLATKQKTSFMIFKLFI